MATAATNDFDAQDDYGRLSNNYMLVQGLQNALSRSELNLQSVPRQLRLIIAEDAWKAFLLPDGRIVRNSADFRVFIESQRPDGCQTPLHVLRHMVKGTPVADTVEVLLRGTPGAPEGVARNPGGANQWINRNNETVNPSGSVPVVIPMPKAEKPKRVRDYSRESKQGNSVGYTLRRLEKTSPELLAKVKAGDMSPNAAAIKAGFRDKVITVPNIPRKAAQVLLRHFQGAELNELIKLLKNGLKGK